MKIFSKNTFSSLVRGLGEREFSIYFHSLKLSPSSALWAPSPQREKVLRNFSFSILFIVLFLPSFLFAMEGETKIYLVGPLAIEAPVGYLKVEEIGPSAYNITLIDKDPQIKNAWITAVIMSQEQVKQLAPGTSLAYFKTTYLGSNKAAEKRNVREILKKKVWGDWQESKIPKPLMLEAYELPLADGSVLFLGFRRLESFSAEKAEKFFNLFSSTLRENTPKQK